LISQRYGISQYHHPEILEALGTFAPEIKLLEMIDVESFDSPAPGVGKEALINWNASSSVKAVRLLAKPDSYSPFQRRAEPTSGDSQKPARQGPANNTRAPATLGPSTLRKLGEALFFICEPPAFTCRPFAGELP
jgi:hypothetical protein